MSEDYKAALKAFVQDTKLTLDQVEKLKAEYLKARK